MVNIYDTFQEIAGKTTFKLVQRHRKPRGSIKNI